MAGLGLMGDTLAVSWTQARLEQLPGSSTGGTADTADTADTAAAGAAAAATASKEAVTAATVDMR